MAALEEVERRFAAIPGVHAAGATAGCRSATRTRGWASGSKAGSRLPTRRRERTSAPSPHATSRPWACGSSAGASSARPIPSAAGGNRQSDNGRSLLARRVTARKTRAARRHTGMARGRRRRRRRPELGPRPSGQSRDVSPGSAAPLDDGVLRRRHGPARRRPRRGVREALRAVDPDLAWSSVRTMEEVAQRSNAARQSTMILLACSGPGPGARRRRHLRRDGARGGAAHG